MNKVPSLNYEKVINALRRDGWIVVRQRGSHIRLQKRTPDEIPLDVRQIVGYILLISLALFFFKLAFSILNKIMKLWVEEFKPLLGIMSIAIFMLEFFIPSFLILPISTVFLRSSQIWH